MIKVIATNAARATTKQAQCVKMDSIKKLIARQKTIQIFKDYVKGFRTTTEENHPKQKL